MPPSPDRALRPAHPHVDADLWFRARPRLVLVVVAVLFAAVLVLRLVADDPLDAWSMLYVFPVALAATAFGVRGGVAAGLVAVVLVGVWVAARDVDLSLVGWLTRVLPLLLLGYLLGRATDRNREIERERRRLEVAAALHREAIEINDSLVQQMSAAKWALEAGRTESGLEALDAALGEAQRLVSGLIRRADMGDHAEVLRPPGAEA